jgi:hypothetical protein
MERCHIISRSETFSKKGPSSSSKGKMSHQSIILSMECPIIIDLKDMSTCARGVSGLKPCDQNLQRPPMSAKYPPSNDGDGLHTGGVITPQSSSKGSKCHQSCVIIIEGGGSCAPRDIMKTIGKIHAPNTPYKVNHVNIKSIR